MLGMAQALTIQLSSYIKKFLPVEIIDKKENFRRIIDHKKNSGWIHISQLQKVKSAITLNDINIFKKP